MFEVGNIVKNTKTGELFVISKADYMSHYEAVRFYGGSIDIINGDFDLVEYDLSAYIEKFGKERYLDGVRDARGTQ